MSTQTCKRITLVLAGITALIGAKQLLGQGKPAASKSAFRRNVLFAYKLEREEGIKLTPEQLSSIDEVLTSNFGTPDEPSLPAAESKVLDLNSLKSAAGHALGNQNKRSGLYRQHCAECHGITGDGLGPRALKLEPYPRDFRRGHFKYKSTPSDIKPKHEDLKRILAQGIPGSAMPAFGMLPNSELDALVHYVKYLSIRGELERSLLFASIQLDGAPVVRAVGESDKPEDKQERQKSLAEVKESLDEIVARWSEAADRIFKVPPRSGETDPGSAKKRGKALYTGSVANCWRCHGLAGEGDPRSATYDHWTKEFIGNGDDQDLVRTFVANGLPPPRKITALDLRKGIYRGGKRPEDLFLRIRNGIQGSQMPAVIQKEELNSRPGLTTDDIWDLVDYVQSMSQPSR